MSDETELQYSDDPDRIVWLSLRDATDQRPEVEGVRRQFRVMYHDRRGMTGFTVPFFLPDGFSIVAGDGAADEKLSPENLIDLLDTAWCVIANAGAGATHDGTVGWHNETAEWKEAAERLRDRWHEVLRLRCASRDEIER